MTVNLNLKVANNKQPDNQVHTKNQNYTNIFPSKFNEFVGFVGLCVAGGLLGHYVHSEWDNLTWANFKTIDFKDHFQKIETFVKDKFAKSTLPVAVGAAVGGIIGSGCLFSIDLASTNDNEASNKTDVVEVELKQKEQAPVAEMSSFLTIDPTTLQIKEKVVGNRTIKTTTAKTLSGGTITSEEQTYRIGAKDYRLQKQIFIA